MRRFAVALAVVAIVGVGVRVAFVAAAAKPLPEPGDALAYHLLADGIASGDGYVRPFDRIEGRTIATAEYGPGYPSLLAVADVAGVDTTWGQRYLGALTSAVGIVLVGIAGRRAGGGSVGGVAALIVALHPLAVGHDTTLLTEGVALALGALVLVLALQWLDDPRTSRAVALGGALGASALVRSEALVAAVVLVGAMVAASRHRRSAIVALAVAAAVVAPWTVRNAIRLDAFVPLTTNAATAVAGANCEPTYAGSLVGYWRFGAGCFEGYETADLVARGEADVAADHLRDGIGRARRGAGRLPAVVAARVARVWGLWDADQQAYLAALEGKHPDWERAGTFVSWGVLVLAAAGAVVARRDRERLFVLAAPCVAVTLTAAATYGNARFRAGAEPALAVLAAVALVMAAARVRR
ncbi:MAG TPA: glycosyltransferase family 39 protein [Acidimicrobiales bacterium]